MENKNIRKLLKKVIIKMVVLIIGGIIFLKLFNNISFVIYQKFLTWGEPCILAECQGK